MAKARTEAALERALSDRTSPLNKTDVDRMASAAGCSPATLYKSNAVKTFRARLAGPAPKATKGTKETMDRLRGTVKMLANCVQNLALKVDQQEQELIVLRQRANSNVTAFPQAKKASRRTDQGEIMRPS